MAQQGSRRKLSGRRESGSARRNSGRGRSPVDPHEVEWPFDAAGLEPVRAWLRQHSSGLEPEQKITDTYCNAGDRRFYRAGYARRVRKNGARTTAKSLSPAEGNERRRGRRAPGRVTKDAAKSPPEAKGSGKIGR